MARADGVGQVAQRGAGQAVGAPVGHDVVEELLPTHGADCTIRYMNQVVHVEAVLPAPPEVVFAQLADPTGWPAWSGHDRGEALAPGPANEHGVGSVRAFTYGRYRSVEEVVVSDGPRHFAYVLRSGLPVRGYRADVRLEPGDEGATAISWHAEFRPVVPFTGPFLRRRLDRFIGTLLDGLAAHLAVPPVP